MLPYLDIHREHLILLLGFGGFGVLGLILALNARRFGLGAIRHDSKEHFEEFPDGIKEGHGKVPLFLILLYLSLGIWAVLYVAAHAFWDMDFGG